jgi:hypothetical protein
VIPSLPAQGLAGIVVVCRLSGFLCIPRFPERDLNDKRDVRDKMISALIETWGMRLFERIQSKSFKTFCVFALSHRAAKCLARIFSSVQLAGIRALRKGFCMHGLRFSNAAGRNQRHPNPNRPPERLSAFENARLRRCGPPPGPVDLVQADRRGRKRPRAL